MPDVIFSAPGGPLVGIGTPRGSATNVSCTGTACQGSTPMSPWNGVGNANVTVQLGTGQQGTCASCFAYYLPYSPLITVGTGCEEHPEVPVEAIVLGAIGSPQGDQQLEFAFVFQDGTTLTLMATTDDQGFAFVTPPEGGPYTVTVTNLSAPGSAPMSATDAQPFRYCPPPLKSRPPTLPSAFKVTQGAGFLRPQPSPCYECQSDLRQVVWSSQLDSDSEASAFSLALATNTPALAAADVRVQVEPTAGAVGLFEENRSVQAGLTGGGRATEAEFVGPVVDIAGPEPLAGDGAAPNGLVRVTLPYEGSAVGTGLLVEVMELQSQGGQSYWTNAGITNVSASRGEVSAVLPAFRPVTVVAVGPG
jgi:hypothetical protein